MPNKEQNINKNNEEKARIHSQDQHGIFNRIINKLELKKKQLNIEIKKKNGETVTETPKDLANRLTKKYKIKKKKHTNLETLATLGKDLSEYDPASIEGILSYLKLSPAEKKLLQQRTIEMNSKDRIIINSQNRPLFINFLNEKHRLKSNTPLSEKKRAALIEDLDKFYYIPLKLGTCHNFIFDLDIVARRDVGRLINDQLPKVNELITQVIDDATIDITNKYQLLENHTVSEEKLEATANEIMDLNLDEEVKREVIGKLELSKEDRVTLRKIYRKKQDSVQKQESKTDANLKELTKDDDEISFYQQVDDAAITIINKYCLSITENKLKAIADEIMDLNFSEEQKEEVIFQLGLQTEDVATLLKIYRINLMKAEQLFYQQANNATIHATIDIINKYQLLENQSFPEEKLKTIANEIMDLNLSEEYKREVVFELKISEEDRATLQTIYRERQEFLKAQESKTDAKIDENTKGEDKVSFNQQVDNAVIGIINKYQLSIHERKLKAIAKEIFNLQLSEEQKEEVIIRLGIQKGYKDTLLEIFKELQKWPTPAQSKIEVIIKGAKALKLFNQQVHDSVTFITTKYQLSEDQATYHRKLTAIAKEIIDLNLSEEQKREVIIGLEIPEADREALWKIYRKLEILPKIKESKTDSRVNDRTQNGHSDDGAQLINKNNNKKQIIRRNLTEAVPFFFKGINDTTIAITTKYQLSEDQPNPPKKLNAIANEILNLNLNEQQKREVIFELEIPETDREKLNELINKKTTLLNQAETLQESAKTNLSSILSQGLNNFNSKPNTPLQTSLKSNLRSLLKKSGNNLGSEPLISPKPNASKGNPLKRVNNLGTKPQTLLNQTIHLSKDLDKFSR